MKIFLSFLLTINLVLSLETKFIKYEEDGSTVILTINRPKVLNALNNQVLDEIDEIFEEINVIKTRAIIITGEGEKSFVAGADISELSNFTMKQAEDFSIPVIAAINGYAFGAGLGLAMSCDIRICSDNAIFGQPETGLGIIPGFGGTQRLARIIGMGMAKQMIFTGQKIDANEAHRLGLVNSIYPQKELLNEAKKLAAAISKNGQTAIQYSKMSINEGIQYNLERGLQIEERFFVYGFSLPEQKEAMKKFLDKSTVENETNKAKGKLKLTNTYAPPLKLLTKDLTIPAMPAILTAGDKNKYNSMTIGWGSIGVGYARPIFTVYVKPERYTYQVIDESKYFTVSYIDKNLYKKFNAYGSKSGKDINKEEVSGTHIQFLDDGGITFEEAVEVFVCKIIAKSHVQESEVHQDIIEMYKKTPKVYPSTIPHTMYVGEIIGHYKRE